MLLEGRCGRGGQPRRSVTNLGMAWVVAAGMALTLFAGWMGHDRETHEREETFGQLAASRSAAITDELRELRDIKLEGLAHFWLSHPTATSEEFQRYATYLTTDSAVQAWLWIPVVAAADKSRFEEDARAAGWKDFQIWQNDGHGGRVAAGPTIPCFKWRQRPGIWQLWALTAVRSRSAAQHWNRRRTRGCLPAPTPSP